MLRFLYSLAQRVVPASHKIKKTGQLAGFFDQALSSRSAK
jgi:hypothetical protein